MTGSWCALRWRRGNLLRSRGDNLPLTRAGRARSARSEEFFWTSRSEGKLMALTWDDLIIEEISPQQFQQWIEPWIRIIAGRVAPAFLSKFGTWFLRRPEGYVEMLDVFTGTVHRVADSYEDFLAEVNQQWWQEVYLLSELVLHLHEAGKVPGPGQCYALAPHPALGGPNPLNGDAVDPRFVMLMEVFVWQEICWQAVSGRG